MNASKLIIFTVHEVLDEQERKSTPKLARKSPRTPPHQIKRTSTGSGGKLRPNVDTETVNDSPENHLHISKETKENKPSTKRPLNTQKDWDERLGRRSEMTKRNPKPPKAIDDL
ncbi:hypothetical protein Bca101_060877 [Brassica carinata]